MRKKKWRSEGPTGAKHSENLRVKDEEGIFFPQLRKLVDKKGRYVFTYLDSGRKAKNMLQLNWRLTTNLFNNLVFYLSLIHI